MFLDQFAILAKFCLLFSSTANQMTPFPVVLQEPIVDWLKLFMAWSEQLCFEGTVIIEPKTRK